MIELLLAPFDFGDRQPPQNPLPVQNRRTAEDLAPSYRNLEQETRATLGRSGLRSPTTCRRGRLTGSLTGRPLRHSGAQACDRVSPRAHARVIRERSSFRTTGPTDEWISPTWGTPTPSRGERAWGLVAARRRGAARRRHNPRAHARAMRTNSRRVVEAAPRLPLRHPRHGGEHSARLRDSPVAVGRALTVALGDARTGSRRFQRPRPRLVTPATGAIGAVPSPRMTVIPPLRAKRPARDPVAQPGTRRPASAGVIHLEQRFLDL